MNEIFVQAGSIQYVDGSDSLKIDPIGHIKLLVLRFDLTHNNSSADFGDDKIFDIIDTLEIIGDGRFTPFSIKGKDIYDYARLTSYDVDYSQDTTDGSSKTSYFEAVIPVYIPQGFSSIKLRVNFNSSIGSGITIVSGTLKVGVLYTDYLPYALKTTFYQDEFSGEKPYNLPINEIPYIFLIKTSDYSDSFDNIELKDGITTFIKADYQLLRILGNDISNVIQRTGVVGFAFNTDFKATENTTLTIKTTTTKTVRTLIITKVLQVEKKEVKRTNI